MFRTAFLLFLLISGIKLQAQTALTGNIYDNTNRSQLLEGVMVKNLTNKGITLTNRDGRFALSAKVGDLISFGMMGYETDTVYLTNLFPRNVYLRAVVNKLNAVDITSTKVSPFLDVKDADATPARPVDISKDRGGVRLNLGYGKYRRTQQKIQELEEDEQYNEEIINNFSIEFVKKLLKIDGEDLKNFMQMYRPTIDMIKSERPFNYEYYTAKSYSDWMKLPPEQRKPSSILKSKGNN